MQARVAVVTRAELIDTLAVTIAQRCIRIVGHTARNYKHLVSINNHRATLIDSIDPSSNQHTSTISQLKVQQIAFADRVARVALVDRHELTDDHRTRLRYANDIDARLVCKLALNLCHDIRRECEVGAFDRARARARV